MLRNVNIARKVLESKGFEWYTSDKENKFTLMRNSEGIKVKILANGDLSRDDRIVKFKQVKKGEIAEIL